MLMMATAISHQGLCRLCGKPITRRGIPKEKWINLAKEALSVDFDTDRVDVHPLMICEPCDQKLTRWNLKRKKKARAQRGSLNIVVHEFELEHEQSSTKVDSRPTDLLSAFSDLHQALIEDMGLLVNRTEKNIMLILPDNNGNSKVCVTINENGLWTIKGYGRLVDTHRTHYKDLPTHLDIDSFPLFITGLHELYICPGNPEFVVPDLVLNGKPVYIHHQPSSSTVRHTACPILVQDDKRCSMCRMYRSNLAAISKRHHATSSPAPKTNYKHMKPVKLAKRLKTSKGKEKIMKKKISKLEGRIKAMFEKEAVAIGETESAGFAAIFQKEDPDINNKFPQDSPQQLLWQEQKKRLSRNPKGMRWHPAVIRLCIALCAKSPKAYDILRTSGFLTLPTHRTLRCYTHFTTHKPGFNKEFIERVCADMNLKSLGETQRKVTLAFDEMKVSQGLVYSHSTGDITGFTSLGTMNTEFEDFARKCGDSDNPKMASHVLVLMVRAICSSYRKPVAYFSTHGVTSDQLYAITMEALEYLTLCGFVVKALVSDGASANRGLYKLLTSSSPHDHCFVSPFNDETVYLFSDVPHLMKTTRNNLENSGYHQKTRNLKFRGLDVSWQHILQVYEWDMKSSRSLRLLHRIGEDHVHLTSSHRMKVKLAAQVLSSTMANALRMQGDPSTESTRTVIDYFDQFFDCLNVSALHDGDRRRKPALQPYRDVNDWRFTWLQEDFLGLLDEWESEGNLVKVTQAEREKLHLSKQTLDGIRMTVNSFVELSGELLSSGAKYILSEKFSQDPLEEYFAKQRGLGGKHDNPTVDQFGSNMLTLEVAGTCIRASKRANVASGSGTSHGSIDNSSLPRKRLFKK